MYKNKTSAGKTGNPNSKQEKDENITDLANQSSA